MNRRVLGGVLLTFFVLACTLSLWAWWRAWNAPLVRVVFRPAFSIQDISAGTPVRVQGVVVGQVSSVGLFVDGSQRLRPEVVLSLDLATLEDRGFADRLRGDRLTEAVQQGLRAHLVAVNPASGLLQVELFWDPADPVPAGLARNEIPASGVTTQRAIERVGGVRVGRQFVRGQESVVYVIAKDESCGLTTVAFHPDFANAFAELNRAWIEQHFALEETDRAGDGASGEAIRGNQSARPRVH